MDVSRLDGEMGLFWQGHTHPCVRMFSVTQDIIGVAYGMWFVELGFFLCCTCNYFLTIDQLIFVTLRWQSASSLLAVQYMAGDGKNDTTTRRQTVRRRWRGGVEAANERTIQLSMQYIHSGTQQQCTMLVIVHSNSSSTQCQGRKKAITITNCASCLLLQQLLLYILWLLHSKRHRRHAIAATAPRCATISMMPACAAATPAQ